MMERERTQVYDFSEAHWNAKVTGQTSGPKSKMGECRVRQDVITGLLG